MEQWRAESDGRTLRHAHSVPPAAKRLKVDEIHTARPRSAPPSCRGGFDPDRIFKQHVREDNCRWTPSLGARGSGSYEVEQ